MKLDRNQRKALWITLALAGGVFLLWKWGRSATSPATAEEAERQRVLDNMASQMPPTVRLIEENVN